MWTSTKGMVGDKILYDGELCGRIVSIHLDEDPEYDDESYATGVIIRYIVRLEGEYKDADYPYITLDEVDLDCGGPYTISLED